MDNKLVVFRGKEIRRILEANEWLFSVFDIIAALTDSDKPRDYWHRMKKREKESSGVELSTLCRQLKIQASDGKKYLTDMVNTENVFRIIQSIPSPKAEPFKEQSYFVPKKSVFNKIVGDGQLEIEFASFLDGCEDIISYAKNYFAVNLRIDYVKADGNISNYYPDFIVKVSEKEIYIVETKGLEDLDVPPKIERLKQWCEDVNRTQSKIKFDFIYVDEESFKKYNPKSFKSLIDSFREYKD